MKEHAFTAHDTEYEVKIAHPSDGRVIVQAFNVKTGKPASASYSITYEVNIDLALATGISGVKTIIDAAKDDVINKRSEEVAEIMKNAGRQLVTSSEIDWI